MGRQAPQNGYGRLRVSVDRREWSDANRRHARLDGADRMMMARRLQECITRPYLHVVHVRCGVSYLGRFGLYHNVYRCNSRKRCVQVGTQLYRPPTVHYK
jgi:hypothetical protein